MHEAREPGNICHVATLPYELRQRIFRYALEQKGTLGLHTPLWDDGKAFSQPLFAVSRSFRGEALEAFYRANTFLWHVHRPQNAGARPDSDPSKYPLEGGRLEHSLTPRLPWQYPRLMKDLRYLVINIFLPSQSDADAWSTTFPQQLHALVTALEHGDRLKELQVNIITGYWRSGRPIPQAYMETLGIVAELRVAGTVKVVARPIHNAACISSVFSLGLQEKIKV